jgi:hypothetical protein
MGNTRTKADVVARIGEHREHWRQLVAEVGEERMGQPGPMGAWTFKDLAAHLTSWRDWTIARVEAGPEGEAPTPWPADLIEYDPRNADLTDWDPVNAWIYAQNRDRSVHEVLADADASFVRLAAAIAALPEVDVTTPGRFPWLDGPALADADFGGHLRDEHEPDIRAWLDGRSG